MKKALLLGDSIRMGYDDMVRGLLAGRAEVLYDPEDNGRFAAYTLWQANQLLRAHGPVDVVHWNNGYWDMNIESPMREPIHPIPEYQHFLRRILGLCRSCGAQVIFATAPPLMPACRRIAARHPEVKVLNCSVAMPYPGVRTYYSRVYEAKFVTGAIAGAYTKNDMIGYVASSPTYGVPASINAFALGAQLTNPRARVRLVWSAVSEDPISELKDMGVDVISNRDVATPNTPQGDRGLSLVLPGGGLKPLASPYWDWGNFYIRLLSSILNGGWDGLNYRDGGKAVNYWWGMASGAVGLELADDLDGGVRSLANILCRGLIDGTLTVFHRRYRSQDGKVVSDGNHWLSPEDVLHMDYLLDSVDGSIPGFDELLPMARSMVRLQGVYRDSLPPERGEAK